MTVSNVNPASGETLTPAASFSFEVTDPYTSLLVRVTTSGGVLEAAYDDAVAPGYTVSIEDLGATHRITVSRDAGWDDDPMSVYITENGTDATSWTYDVFPTQVYPEGMRPYNDSADGDAAGVLTFNGRGGNVLPIEADYTAFYYTEAEVDALFAALPDHGGLAGLSDDDHPQYHTDARGDVRYYLKSEIDALFDSIDESDVALNNVIGTHLFTTQQDWNRYTGSTSRVNGGGTITDDGDGTVTVTAGEGILRATDSDSEVFYKVNWASTPLTPVDNDLNYIYYEYNAGTPQMVITTTKRTDLNTNIFIGTVYRSGTFIHETNHVTPTGNVSAKLTKRFNDTEGLTRASGSVPSEAGTRNLAVTAGTWWHGLDEASIAAFDTSAADTFLYFYEDGVGGWTVVSAQTQIDNLQYDDGSGTLATLSANRYGVHWVYVGVDDDLYVVYGKGDYTSAQWPNTSPPASIPPHMQEQHAGLIGRVVIQKSAATFTDLATPWGNEFAAGGVSDHGDLAGLTDDDHTQYSLADGTRDLQGLWLNERADHVNTPATGKSELWLNSAITPPRLMFTNESGTDGTVIVHRSGAPGNNAILTGYGTEGTVDSTTLFTYNSGNGELALAAVAGSPIRLKEGATIAAAPGATMGSLWVKNDDPNRLHYYDEASDHTLAYLSELNDGTVDHGSLSGLTDDDHVRYVDIAGTREQDAVRLTDRAAPVNAPGGAKSELWTRTATNYPELILTDKSGLDWTVAKSYLPAQGEIPYWNVGTGGDYLTVHDNLKFDGSALQLGGTTASLNITERTTGPTNTTAIGKLWVKDGADQLLKFTDDLGRELTLNQSLDDVINQLGNVDNDVTVPTLNPVILRGGGGALIPLTVEESNSSYNALSAEHTLADKFPLRLVSSTDQGWLSPRSFKIKEGAAKPVANGAAYGQLWVNNSATQQFLFTDDSETDNTVMLWDMAGALPTADGVIPLWDSTKQRFDQPTDTFAMQSNELKHLGTNPVYTQVERSAAPGSTTARGKWWVKNDAPCKPMFTDDTGVDMYLGMREIMINCYFQANGTTNQWYTWASDGPYDENLWNVAAGGTGTTPSVSTGNVFQYQGLYFPRKARIISCDITGWCYSTTTLNMEVRFRGMSLVDNATTAGTSYTHISYDRSFTAAKRYVNNPVPTINDSTINANTMLYGFVRRTDATSNNDVKATIVIRYQEEL